ncbi:SDR family oxidoreductase [Streptomyces sp. NBC_01422]|uniref:SDR family oxidoreductase n=1 Tax=Streptomyces sp. NBC_01422 TaxID=2903859 RepID=UPI002E2CA01D|nr:SDR family oxidoreductase [Streptomyces sp. NBC_01422]
MRIAVAGGTGWLGKHVVEEVRATGHEAVVLSRSCGVDLTTGQGLDDALRDVPRIIDVTNLATTNRKRSEVFFNAATSHLLEAGRTAGIEHHVALSIVGAADIDFGYYFGKRRQEELVLASGLPTTVLRATQFHEFAAQMLGEPGTGGPFAVVPQMYSQPVAAREVAAALVRTVLGPAAGMAPELAGPEKRHMTAMVRQLKSATGRRKVILPVRAPGSVGRRMAGGGLLPRGKGPRGKQTFDEWVDEYVRALN